MRFIVQLDERRDADAARQANAYIRYLYKNYKKVFAERQKTPVYNDAIAGWENLYVYESPAMYGDSGVTIKLLIVKDTTKTYSGQYQTPNLVRLNLSQASQMTRKLEPAALTEEDFFDVVAYNQKTLAHEYRHFVQWQTHGRKAFYGYIDAGSDHDAYRRQEVEVEAELTALLVALREKISSQIRRVDVASSGENLRKFSKMLTREALLDAVNRNDEHIRHALFNVRTMTDVYEVAGYVNPTMSSPWHETLLAAETDARTKKMFMLRYAAMTDDLRRVYRQKLEPATQRIRKFLSESFEGTASSFEGEPEPIYKNATRGELAELLERDRNVRCYTDGKDAWVFPINLPHSRAIQQIGKRVSDDDGKLVLTIRGSIVERVAYDVNASYEEVLDRCERCEWLRKFRAAGAEMEVDR